MWDVGYGLDPLSNQEMQCNNKSNTIQEIPTILKYIPVYLLELGDFLALNIFYDI